jgi:hypothetical protein
MRSLSAVRRFALCLALLSSSTGAAADWTRSWGNRGHDIAFGLAHDDDDNLYVGSQFAAVLELEAFGGRGSLKSAGRSDVLLASFDARGKSRWQRQLRSTGAAEVREIAVARDGTVVATGYFVADLAAARGERLRSHGGSDAWIVAVDSTGTLRFARGFGGKAADAGLALAPLADGGVVFAGTFQHAARFGEQHGNARVLRAAGARDAFIARVSRTGAVEWAFAVGGAGDDHPIAIAPAPDGGFVALIAYHGSVQAGAGAATQTFESHGGTDALLLRYAADGTLRSAVSIGHPGPDAWDALTVGWDGATWIAGRIVASATISFGAQRVSFDGAGSSDIVLATWNADGRFERALRLGNEAADTPHRLVASSDGGVLLAAAGSGTLTLGDTRLAEPAPRGYVARVARDGRVESAAVIGGEGITQPSGLARLGDGRIAVLGMFEKELAHHGRGAPIRAQGKTDVFLVVRKMR